MTTPVLPTYRIFDDPGPNASYIPPRLFTVTWRNAYGADISSRHFDVGGVQRELDTLLTFGIVGNVSPPLPTRATKKVKFKRKTQY